MSSDLISRSAVIDLIRPRLNSSKEGTLEHQRLYSLLKSVEELPIAYDVDKVVEQLSCENCKDCPLVENCTANFGDGFMEKIGEIVKAGSVYKK